MAQELQEFHISVTPLGEDQYLVRTEHVAPGVPLAEEQVFWPVEDWLSVARQLMNDPLLGLFSGNDSGMEEIFFLPDSQKRVSQSCLNLVSLGQEMYNALFQGSLRDSWLVAQAIAQNQRQMLRLRLGLKGNRLPRLPWEVLHEDSRPLATGTDVAFCRYQINTGLMRSLPNILTPPNKPLRILMVIAGPSDQENLELFKEASHLRDELKSGDIQLTVREQLGREELTQELEQGHYQVFHYAGHSSLGNAGGDVYLVSNKTGLTETLNGDDLAGLLANNGVQLAVFNSCRSAYTATSNQLDSGKDRNLAEALVKRGIPGVLAMAERIPDEVALTLTCLLYRNINQGHPIDLSLSRARQGLISAYGSNQLYWALPVLYLTPEFDGYLIDVAGYAWDDEQPLPELKSSWRSPQLEDELPQSRIASKRKFLEDDLENDPMAMFTGYENVGIDGGIDGSSIGDLDSDDPADFIKNLLGELDKELPNGGSNLPILEEKTSRNTGLESGVGQFPIHSSNNQTAPSQQSTSATYSAPSQPSVSQQWDLKSRWRNIPRLWLGLGITGVIAIAVLGISVVFHRQSVPNTPIAANPALQAPHNSQNVNLSEAETATVTNIAIEQLSRGNISAGQKSVEELLNRGALPQAKAALDAVPKTQLDQPIVSFLRGRLAWQFIQQGSKDYNIDDARRYWEIAVKGNPNSSEYYNALGFAYYAEGDFDRANNAWLDALTHLEKTKNEADVARVGADELNVYAGLALGFWKSAQKQPEPKRANLLNEALKLRQKVRADDPVNFQPEALSKNWLWSESAIRDWRKLLDVKK